MTEAAARIEAGGGLLQLSVTHAAVAASMTKDGHRALDRIQKKLTERVKGKTNG